MKVQVKVNDELVQRIDFFAKRMGMSRSSLCAFFIGVGMMSLEKSDTLIDCFSQQISSSVSLFSESSQIDSKN